MNPTVETLVRGSAGINRMNAEIQQVTNLLFGLAGHPRFHKIRHLYDEATDTFRTRLGDFEASGCVWEIWWYKQKFHARCLVQNEHHHTLHQLYVSDAQALDGFKNRQHADSVRWAEGVLEAHEMLQVFVDGMFRDFQLGHAIRPYVEAAEFAS